MIAAFFKRVVPFLFVGPQFLADIISKSLNVPNIPAHKKKSFDGFVLETFLALSFKEIGQYFVCIYFARLFWMANLFPTVFSTLPPCLQK